MTLFQILTSVTRWLLVVIGCVVLAMAQPMSAAAPEAPAAPLSGDTVIFPKVTAGQPQPTTAADAPGTSKSLVLMTALLLAAGGAWFLFQKRKTGPSAGRGRKLQIDETRPLGNRQYLIVADYDGQKFLLGVTPGQIQMLAPLNESKGGAGEEKP